MPTTPGTTRHRRCRASRSGGAGRVRAVLSVDYEITAEVVKRCVKAAHVHGVRIVLDPASAARANGALLSKCHAVAPDAREAAELTGTDTSTRQGATDAARKLV